VSINFWKILFKEYFGKYFQIFWFFSFFAAGLKNFKAPFYKKNFGKFLKFLKFLKIKFYKNFWLYGISYVCAYGKLCLLIPESFHSLLSHKSYNTV